MILETLKLTNYRNHKNQAITLNPKLTVIVGPNGSGKTNILEAINMLSTGKAYRAQYDRQAIHYDADFALISGTLTENDTKEVLQIAIQKSDKYANATNKRLSINNVPKSLTKFKTKIHTVLFAPQDMEIIVGSPTTRRKYIDNIIIQISSQYKKAHTEYIKIVRQRNKLLEIIREENRGHNQLPYWNTKLRETGTQIQQQRQELFDYWELMLPTINNQIDPKITITLKYLPKPITNEKLEEHKAHEIASKSTLMGPHRDDFEILFSNHSFDSKTLADYGSRGQQRTTLLMLKLAELDYIEVKTSQKPVLLLDDILSELDNQHKDIIMDKIRDQQTLITTTEDLFEEFSFRLG
jgi:DNA replication and repair protein RecF